jgi:hypothetical protein
MVVGATEGHVTRVAMCGHIPTLAHVPVRRVLQYDDTVALAHVLLELLYVVSRTWDLGIVHTRTGSVPDLYVVSRI